MSPHTAFCPWPSRWDSHGDARQEDARSPSTAASTRSHRCGLRDRGTAQRPRPQHLRQHAAPRRAALERRRGDAVPEPGQWAMMLPASRWSAGTSGATRRLGISSTDSRLPARARPPACPRKRGGGGESRNAGATPARKHGPMKTCMHVTAAALVAMLGRSRRRRTATREAQPVKPRRPRPRAAVPEAAAQPPTTASRRRHGH